jgi:hypothetical protein
LAISSYDNSNSKNIFEPLKVTSISFPKNLLYLAESIWFERIIKNQWKKEWHYFRLYASGNKILDAQGHRQQIILEINYCTDSVLLSCEMSVIF